MKTKSGPLEEIYLYPSRSLRSLTFSWDLVSKMRFLKSCLFRSRSGAGQHTRFKAFVAIGDYNGHVGLGVNCSKEVATAICANPILSPAR
uniref:S5 DRBM domain-containing protein n=1 Tax=Periophthalmus magnuspinnatus TaxID=409849 RepID=A0A3B4A3J8_9GOBI